MPIEIIRGCVRAIPKLTVKLKTVIKMTFEVPLTEKPEKTGKSYTFKN